MKLYPIKRGHPSHIKVLVDFIYLSEFLSCLYGSQRLYYWSWWRCFLKGARASLELAGDIGKHSQSQRNYDKNLAEMTPEELSAIIDRWEGEKAAIAKDIPPV